MTNHPGYAIVNPDEVDDRSTWVTHATKVDDFWDALPEARQTRQ